MTIDTTQDTSFVINCGRYFNGTTGREYFPAIHVDDPLPDSAMLEWAFEASGVSPEYGALVRALQRYTAPGTNGFSLKYSGGRFVVEMYIVMYPPLLASFRGEEAVRDLRLSPTDPDLNFFMRFEQQYFGQPPRTYDQSLLALPFLFALHFDLTDDLFRERRVREYTLSTRTGAERKLPFEPAHWKGFVWDKEDMLREEQHGYVVDPVQHETQMLDFIREAQEIQGWPGEPDPRALLIPWMFEHTTQNYRLLGLTRKPYKGGLGVYYRLDYPHMLRFLREYDYPASFIAHFESDRRRLEHLQFDIAVVYRVSDGSTIPFRTSIYGMV